LGSYPNCYFLHVCVFSRRGYLLRLERGTQLRLPSRESRPRLALFLAGNLRPPPLAALFIPTHTTPLDIAVLGFPYDTSTPYRPGARFGPRGICVASVCEKPGRSYNTLYGLDPFANLVHKAGGSPDDDAGQASSRGAGMSIVDCGDIPITPFDAAHAFKQMEQGYRQILFHNTSSSLWAATTQSSSRSCVL
jgi:hypothetical protein